MNDKICFPYEDDVQDIPEYVNNIAQIYDKIADKISKDIYTNRLLLSLTENYAYMKNVILYTNGGKRLNEAILNGNGKSQFIYGAGRRGKRLVELFSENNWGGFIDENTEQREYNSLKIIKLDDFLRSYTQGVRVFISNMFETEGIVRNLLRKGIALEDIYVINDFDQEGAKDIYYSLECVRKALVKEKIFVDIGCYDGKDSLNYMDWTGNSQAEIYAFEPDIRNYMVCKRKLDQYTNIKLLNIGLSDKKQELSVVGNGEMSYLAEEGDFNIDTELLDNILQKKQVGFIKMDVEGHEINVLKGSEKIIRNQHPILAVSIYHRRSDIWKIPLLLLEYNKNYCFYIRYYGAANGDTVLYAIDCKK
ncbi:MAG: FkbM family methyltransferase [Dorea sp.]|nr:FkbM family methyltransferase [Dorea sp.]